MKEFQTKLGTMYFDIEFDEVKLYDSNKNYINHDSVECYLKNDETDIDDKVLEERIIEQYKDIDYVDSSIILLGEPVMWAPTMEKLLELWNDYCEECGDTEKWTMEDFKNEIQINQIGQLYFIIYYTEY